MQLELDIFGVEEARANRPPPELKCWFCGEESPNQYTAGLNHPPMGDVCGKAWILLNHCRAIVKHFEGDERFKNTARNCYADGCEIHYRGEYARKPIPACVLLEYDEKRAWLMEAGVPEDKIPVLPGAARSINEGEIR